MRNFILAAAALLGLAGTANAGSAKGDIAVYGGEFSTFRSSQYETSIVGAEYRWADQWNGLRPTVGASYNFDGALYGYAGAYWDLPLHTAPFVITPGIQVGGYSRGGSKDLGSGIEFRDTLEVSYQFPDKQRLERRHWRQQSGR
jgi:hypothetical protein